MSRSRLLGSAALLLFAGYGLVFIWQTSFVMDGQRTFCLFDDAMIALTYARNVVEGHGLTWSRWGAPVEGFSDPLWILVMVLSQLSGLDLGLRPVLVQFASLAILVVNVLAVHRLAVRHFCLTTPALALVPAIATAAYFPLNYWSMVGMESGLQALFVVIGIQWALDAGENRGRRIVPLCVLAALSILLRMDMALFAVAILAWALVTTRQGQHGSAWLRGGLLLVLLLGAYQVFRVSYFGDWLPNTYYLKMTGGDSRVRMLRGALVFIDFLVPVFLTVGVTTLAALATLRQRPKHALALGIVWLYFGYSIYVGGDAWEWSHMTGNRFQCFVMPLLPLLLAGALDTLWSRRTARLPAAIVLGVAMLISADLNGLLVGSDRGVRLGYLLLGGRPYHADSNERVARDIHELARQLPPDTRVAVVWAGIPAYFSDFRMIDTMGYNDREIGKGPWAFAVPLDRALAYYPGHMKYDLERTLRDKQPDVLFQWWPPWDERYSTIMTDSGYYLLETGSFWAAVGGVMWLKESAHLALRWPEQ